MTNTEAITLLKRIADRRLMIHVNGTVMEAEPDEVQEALDLAIAALERERWIPVSERLPEPKTDVIAAWDDGEVWSVWQDWADDEDEDRLEYWNDDQSGIHTVTHWMPLPDPPKEETT